MKVITKALRKNWNNTGAIHQADIRPTPNSKLRLKLLVFKDNQSLCRFWGNLRPHHGKRGGLCRHTAGVVNKLAFEYTHSITGEKRMEYDRRYFAVMGLLISHLHLDVIAHESLHAAIAYVDRLNRRLDWPSKELEEEQLCYPLGFIVDGVARSLTKVWEVKEGGKPKLKTLLK